MLQFALQYRAAIDDIAGNKTASLRQYELDEEEWKIAQQLCDMLKVRITFHQGHVRKLTEQYVDFQRRDLVLFAFNAKPRYGDSSNGSHR
jgi:hypothetical protein